METVCSFLRPLAKTHVSVLIEWATITARNTLDAIVSRVVNRNIVGLPLCAISVADSAFLLLKSRFSGRIPEFHQLMSDIAGHVFACGLITNMFPAILHP